MPDSGKSLFQADPVATTESARASHDSTDVRGGSKRKFEQVDTASSGSVDQPHLQLEQRVKEFREDQQKKEKDRALKEECLKEVLPALRQRLRGCNSLVDILCRVDITVEGWPSPSRQQVDAAYKVAVRQFHPNGRVRLQNLERIVEAEEIFKFVQSMKDDPKPIE